ncbi:MAG: response regulator transcription factor [Rhodobacteraceae bacterium]|nr:response regulator transcription factor [Paracoccaceae bacterium]MBR9822291.1 response regulator transcription factor [Paracoccaceae bacterium]
MRILVVEDEAELGRMLGAALARHDILVDLAPSFAVAEEALQLHDYAAVVLDRTLPDGEGLDLLPLIRARPAPCPVIVLSALSSVDQRVEGLDGGADDYLAKPFATDELLARLRALLRRPSLAESEAIELGRLRFQPEHRSVEIEGSALELPRRELLVLEALLRRAGRVVDRRALEDAVYGYDDEIASNSLDAHVSRLRRKLAPAGLEIHTIRGVGYLLRASE